MTAMPSYMYRDPLQVLEIKRNIEAKEKKKKATCMECANKQSAFGVVYCEIGQSKPGAENMRKCHKFKSKGNK